MIRDDFTATVAGASAFEAHRAQATGDFLEPDLPDPSDLYDPPEWDADDGSWPDAPTDEEPFLPDDPGPLPWKEVAA